MKNSSRKKHLFYRKYGKRFLDIVLSLLAIVILSPLLLILSVLVLIFMGWPIIFKQPRPGKDEKIFNMYKFRTMTNAKDKDGKLLPNEKRLTKFGNFLRKSSLDELPELFCILIGKMSFVGPRPLLVEYLKHYNKEQKQRHNILPGLTGWAQVNGRNNITWTEKFKYDVYYNQKVSLLFDLRIILLTISQLIHRDGIYSAEGEFTENFNGHN